jgi:hypothetical protein
VLGIFERNGTVRVEPVKNIYNYLKFSFNIHSSLRLFHQHHFPDIHFLPVCN